MEEVDEDISRSESPMPSELSRLQEDGLENLDDILTTLNMEDHGTETPTIHTICTTHPIPNPADTAGPSCPTVRFSMPELFSRADDTFYHVPVRTPGPLGAPPPPEIIDDAIKKLCAILNPSQGPNSKGYKHADLNLVLCGRLELMLAFLQLYAGEGYKEWGKKADIITKSAGKGAWISRQLRQWTIAFMKDSANLPNAEYGKFTESILDDEDLAQEIHMHLQSLGPYICAQDVVNYMGSEE
jgi:hypothetical protein